MDKRLVETEQLPTNGVYIRQGCKVPPLAAYTASSYEALEWQQGIDHEQELVGQIRDTSERHGGEEERDGYAKRPLASCWGDDVVVIGGRVRL